jgi:hypothetical protein
MFESISGVVQQAPNKTAREFEPEALEKNTTRDRDMKEI